MSAATKQAVDDAIAAHFADEIDGGVVTGYVMQITGATIADFKTGDEVAHYLRCLAERMHPAMAAGLASYLHSACDELMFPEDGFSDGHDA